MHLGAPKNINYSATVIRIPTTVELDGLDNLVGVPALGHQALTQRGKRAGELVLAFTAETQLSHAYAHHNNLYRDAGLNADPNEKGYLEANRRIRAIKLRGHRSDALIMPLESVMFTGFYPGDFREGDTFDHLNGQEICRKYEVPIKASSPAKTKIERAFRRVDKRLFPEHLETDQYHRSKHLLKAGREVVVTQKLHGTSIRVGRVPVLHQKTWRERIAAKLFRIAIPEYDYDAVYGSRKVIKDPNNPNQDHFYDFDLWTWYGEKIADLIPEGFIVYGELIGWLPDGQPIQKNYTYHLRPGECELYVYRVATINRQGTLADLPWDGVKEFCRDRGLKWTPELRRGQVGLDDFWDMDHFVAGFLDTRYFDDAAWDTETFAEPLPLSDAKTVDEGICLRQEGIVPTILKAKSPEFLIHETHLLDKGEESVG